MSDATVRCPYNPNHTMRAKRLGIHVEKCKRQFPNADIKQCPFNSLHYASRAEYDNHLATCPDRVSVERLVFSPPSAATMGPPEKPKPANDGQASNEPDEDWEKEAVFPNYDARAVCMSRGLPLTVPVGLPKSGRQKFYQEERLRLAKFEEKVKTAKRLGVRVEDVNDESDEEDGKFRKPVGMVEEGTM